MTNAAREWGTVDGGSDRDTAGTDTAAVNDQSGCLPWSLISLLLVGLLVVGGASLSHERFQQASRLRQAALSLVEGNDDAAARLWMGVLDDGHRIADASAGAACALWNLGYQDQALLYYRDAMVTAGRAGPTRRSRCFFTDLAAHRIKIVRLDATYTVLMADTGAAAPLLRGIVEGSAPPGAASAFAEAIAPYREPDIAQRLLAAACLADLTGLKLMAATYLNLATVGTVRSAGALKQCAFDMVGAYVTAKVDGREVFQPKDRARRWYTPGKSPAPAPADLARTLP
ncbi:hypothetical protein COUCH_00610 [Couchioplanes caeruleus]|uniref:hypothetical protein n=1 Tax=Couchioplanes caeruleus TaxID=56438 RepID=UPI0020C1249C|nr:hypothetical protein [Couchioplanes caeruleus]UQU64902.1 hypothetical protein COUCH_00610 [Couchioplanes caeruleus]